jgi:hypothetical protein
VKPAFGQGSHKNHFDPVRWSVAADHFGRGAVPLGLKGISSRATASVFFAQSTA